jgi:hypothetical protein
MMTKRLLVFALPIIAFIGATLSLLLISQPTQSASPMHGGDIPLDLKEPSDFPTVIYIDPSSATPGDGSSPSTPLASWEDANLQSDTAYVQKRGTTDNITSAIVAPDDVLLGAYGTETEPRPIIYDTSTDITYMIQIAGDRVTVRDLEIVSPRPTSGIHFAAGYWPEDGMAWNNSVHGVDANNYLMWGIRVFGANTKVLHNEIYFIGDDGIFAQYMPNIEIGYNDISKVNQKWFENENESHSSGDGIQFSQNTGFYIHHNTVDRTDTGNKFCIIVQPNEAGSFGLVENNVCRTSDKVTGLYAAYGNYELIVRNNVFEYPGSDRKGIGVYSHCTEPRIYNNVFIGHSQAINLWQTSAEAQIHHNTFYNIGWAAIRGRVAQSTADNNIFALDDGAVAITYDNGPTETMSHNLFTHADQTQGAHAIVGDPLFVDAAQDNFHLQANSPAVNAGTNTGIDQDAEGNSRVDAPDLGAFEFIPALRLSGSPGNGTAYLTWTADTTLPVTSTWRISYDTDSLPNPIVETDSLNSSARQYTLTGLTNYELHTIMLEALVDSSVVLSDTIQLMPTDKFVYLPTIIK